MWIHFLYSCTVCLLLHIVIARHARWLVHLWMNSTGSHENLCLCKTSVTRSGREGNQSLRSGMGIMDSSIFIVHDLTPEGEKYFDFGWIGLKVFTWAWKTKHFRKTLAQPELPFTARNNGNVTAPWRPFCSALATILHRKRSCLFIPLWKWSATFSV